MTPVLIEILQKALETHSQIPGTFIAAFLVDAQIEKNSVSSAELGDILVFHVLDRKNEVPVELSALEESVPVKSTG